MTNKKKQYREVVRRYMDSKASDEELEIFFRLLREGKLNRYLQKAMDQEEKALLMPSVGKAGSGGPWRTYALAAAVCGLIAGTTAWWRNSHRHTHRPVPTLAVAKDIAPGRNHALLTVPGGKTFDLDSNSASVLPLRAGTRLVKSASGEWVYQTPASEKATVLYNTLSAPRGGQFPFVLEDGTRVWLNAASSLRFPTAFQGSTREVFLEGEAYFEVAPDARKTFQVHVGNEAVTVLGTTFNVNGYTDEPAIRTTLISGSVRLERNGASVLMYPGQIASLDGDGAARQLDDADAAEASVAWRNGLFSFDQDDIQTVMRQISRWYDVDIRYEGPVTKALFGGDIGRDLTLMQVLKVLEKSQVHFSLENKVLTVLP